MEDNLVPIILGCAVVISYVLMTYNYILLLIRILLNKISPPNYLKKYGRWAVVTGCTDGIGLAYTRELAKRGFSVMLISRSKEKLQAVAADLEFRFKVETKIVVADFTSGREIYSKIADEIKSMNIGILVNNVGATIPGLWLMETSSEEQIWNLVSCNVLAATMMTTLVLPGMKMRKRGAIVNVSSVGGLLPTPYVAIYGATKYYVQALSKSIRYECRDSGVIIQSLYPGFVKTNMLPKTPEFEKSSNITIPTPETYASHAILTLGVAESTAGYFVHEIQAQMNEQLPQWIPYFYQYFLYKTYYGHDSKPVTKPIL